METLLSELEAAMEAEITPKVLDILVTIAREAIYHDDKEFAADLLVLALQYPIRPETLEDAETMFSDLEAELCPRVILDAVDWAQRMTLEDMVARVLAKAAE